MSLQAIRFVDKATGQRIKLSPKGWCLGVRNIRRCGPVDKGDFNLCAYLYKGCTLSTQKVCQATNHYFEVIE